MKTANPTSAPPTRDQYGALSPANVLTPEQLQQLNALRDAAVKAGKLPAPFISGDKKEFECLNLDIYNVLLFRGKVNDVTTVDSATCVKRAKNMVALGELVSHYQGKVVVTCKSPSIETWTGFKVLAKDGAGRLVSAYDGSLYSVNRWRSQAAREGHGGGFYYYLDQQLAIDATGRGETFSDSVSSGKHLVLCEVEISGRDIEYDFGKRAATRLRVIQELQAVAVSEDAES